MSFICEYCSNVYNLKYNLSRHQNSESCKKIQNVINNYNNKNNEKIKEIETKYLDKIKLLELEVSQLTQENTLLKSENKSLEKSNESFRKIVEKAATKTTILKKDIIDNNTFEIDISLNNKQLNKTKYKDIPEETIKNEIKSLKLKDNYQLDYREEDGYINITNLCKAGGKEFKNWNKNDKTKKFLDVLSSTVLIRTVELLKQEKGGNGERHTWAHPQIAINIAQWISPEFDVLVSKWVYEIMLTGKVDIRDNKTTEELDTMNKENKLLKNRIKLLESKVLQKQPRETFEENKNVIYIVTTEYKEAQGHYKIGKAQNLQKRMSVYNTTDKHEVIYNTSCKNKKSMDLLEQLVHMKLEDKRIEPNKEWFESEEDAEDFIKVIEECKKMFN
jgi:hypothetical protein